MMRMQDKMKNPSLYSAKAGGGYSLTDFGKGATSAGGELHG